MAARPWMPAAVVTVVLAADRLTKNRVREALSPGESLPVVPDVLHLTHIENTGAAFGMLRDATPFLSVFSALSVVALSAYLWIRSRGGRESGSSYGWTLVLAGALGNLYDRLAYGHVVDMIDLRVWPVFNIADMSICCGVALVLGSTLKPSRPGRV
ncbi:MAG: Lipoprotein signal peptidase [Candidatus Omnitrophica bacterium]|nr:Lipoprotein signal peptidase [Candidatus Omnitrophota bacterium]